MKFERLLETYFSYAPNGIPFVSRGDAGMAQGKALSEEHAEERVRRNSASCKKRELPKLLFAGHHQSHAASAFYPSPFERAAVLCLDGVGEWATTTAWVGRGNELDAAVGDRFPAFARVCCIRRSRTTPASR